MNKFGIMVLGIISILVIVVSVSGCSSDTDTTSTPTTTPTPTANTSTTPTTTTTESPSTTSSSSSDYDRYYEFGRGDGVAGLSADPDVVPSQWEDAYMAGWYEGNAQYQRIENAFN